MRKCIHESVELMGRIRPLARSPTETVEISKADLCSLLMGYAALLLIAPDELADDGPRPANRFLDKIGKIK